MAQWIGPSVCVRKRVDSLEGVTEEAGSSRRMRGRLGVNDNKLANPLHLCLLRGTTLSTRQLTVLPAVTQHASSSRLSEEVAM